MAIELDLNRAEFQNAFFSLEKVEALAALKTLRKIRQLEWNTLYQDKGLRWEAIQSITDDKGGRFYSIRITQKCRAVVQRHGGIMVFVSIHPDHDSTYE